MKDRTYYIKATSPYITGVVGSDIKLSFKDKIKILFCKKLSVSFIGDRTIKLNPDLLEPIGYECIGVVGYNNNKENTNDKS